jgi:hypothetical protein
MKRILLLVAAGALLACATVAFSDSKTMPAAKPAPKTLKGELVDTGCYLGHEAKGEKHISCATKCIANGMPMGLLTADGKLYLITMDHESADPYNALKNMAGKQVEVTGVVSERGGMRGIDGTAAKAL